MFEKVNSIDLEPIAYKLAHSENGESWDIDRIYKAIEQYRYFLTLTAC